MGAYLHTYKHMPCTVFNRVFAIIYTFAIFALLCHHSPTLLHHPTTVISAALFISDLILAFMWATTTSFRLRPILRQVYPENLHTKDFPAIDIFICTADPYKEPPMNVVNTALSVMAYDYPPKKISVYVSDDGGSELTLFAFMQAAKFAKIWLPFCRNNNIMDRCPEEYFGSDRHGKPEPESEKIKKEEEKELVSSKSVKSREKLEIQSRSIDQRKVVSRTHQGFKASIKGTQVGSLNISSARLDIQRTKGSGNKQPEKP